MVHGICRNGATMALSHQGPADGGGWGRPRCGSLLVRSPCVRPHGKRESKLRSQVCPSCRPPVALVSGEQAGQPFPFGR